MARKPLTPEIQHRLVTAYKIGLSQNDAAAYARVAPHVLERWLADGQVAERGKSRALWMALNQARADFRLGLKAGLMKSAKDGNTRAAEVLLQSVRESNFRAMTKPAIKDPTELVDFGVLEGLSEAQMTAVRLLVSGTRHTLKEVAKKVGIPKSTLAHWRSDPKFQEAIDKLRRQIHQFTVQSFIQGATEGVLAQQEALFLLRQQLNQPDLNVDDAVKIAKTINALAVSMQDRGGYPRIERREVQVEHSDEMPRPLKDESTEDLRDRLRLLKGGR